MFISHNFSKFTDGYLGWFPVLAIVTVTNNIESQLSNQCILVSLPPVICLLIELQIIQVLVFCIFEKLPCFFIMTKHMYIPTYETASFFTSLPASCVCWKIYFVFNCVCGGWWLVHVSPGSGIQVVVNCLVWALGTERVLFTVSLIWVLGTEHVLFTVSHVWALGIEPVLFSVSLVWALEQSVCYFTVSIFYFFNHFLLFIFASELF